MKLTYIQILHLSLGLSLVVTVVGCSHSAKKELAAKASDPIQFGLAVTKDVPIQIQGSGHVTPFATIINAVTFAKMKSSLNQRRELERALAESREQVKQLAGLIPPPHQCDTPCAPEPVPAKPGEYSAAMSSETLPASSCDDCGQRVVPANPAFLHEGDVGASVAP